MVDAVVNLMSNAQKYGGTPPVVRLGAHATPKGEVGISVSDNGEGIPRPEHRRIFEKFYRLDPDLTRGVGGTGLGLYISRELLERMGGRIWVESSGSGGSTFVAELPVAAA
jgi:two-component system phosphate regulon sensor histidine kinase PhoR